MRFFKIKFRPRVINFTESGTLYAKYGEKKTDTAERFENLSWIHVVRDDKEVRTNGISTRKVTKLRANYT